MFFRNLYTYCNNNPVNFTDPFGLWKWYEGWGETIKQFPKAWSDVVTEKTDKAKQNIGIAWGKHKEFHQGTRDSISSGITKDSAGPATMAGVETVGLGSALATGGGIAIAERTAAGILGGGFFVIVGVEIVWVGIDIFQGIQDAREQEQQKSKCK